MTALGGSLKKPFHLLAGGKNQRHPILRVAARAIGLEREARPLGQQRIPPGIEVLESELAVVVTLGLADIGSDRGAARAQHQQDPPHRLARNAVDHAAFDGAFLVLGLVGGRGRLCGVKGHEHAK
jgi:hypothetical protein